ncbi:hypothetical protein BCR33DRAFT_854721 [Rhizoclosmatium globosum]|uniref:N-acetylgalactosaminide beta-1,3-galactosyltransferase n=1 Tax=Rhizoclosmatium globosum TaxID=329046 RepID=A0A1Y2BRQ3_9FUNG|nr:hypothetical protein BCR33DRAFT_854721 [Rhizoclosmatium globosum]|eukprot:ORY37432.1 hypothetical protein BCR33DRAFT_854721 [Rhizoclosmatium globosum]
MRPSKEVAAAILTLTFATLVLSYLYIGNKSKATAHNHRPQGPPTNFAIALKTGNETLNRAKVQLDTFLKGFNHLVVISDAPNVLQGHVVHDVYTGLYNTTKPGRRDDEDDVKPGSGLDDNTPGWFVHTSPKTSLPVLKKYQLDVLIGFRQRDAHKFLPGLRLLYKTYPDMPWYLMIDDDAFVFMHSLSEYVKLFSHTKPYYIGNMNVFVGCDGVTEFGQGPAFAHGGSGILVSNAAMKKVLDGVDGCIVKYRDCFFGDVRVALCMRDVGVKGLPGSGFFGVA